MDMISVRQKTYAILLGCICFLILSCSNDDAGSYVPINSYELRQPEEFPEITYTIANNPITQERFELGRKLFFDPIISLDGSISCNNCHQQSRAFADAPIHPLSIGIDQQTGIRNAPALFNLAFRKEFFWDGGVTHLDFVAINAIESEIEMDDTLKNVVRKLNNHSTYPDLFKKAFDIDSITAPRMLQVFSQFMLLMVSDQSKYDHYIRGENGITFSDSERRGLEAFESKCAQCHSGALFTDQSFRNNGISSTFKDRGRALITESNADEGKFLVPSLRNIEVTTPYMHNAAFTSLEEVLDHYDQGVQDSETLDPMLKDSNGNLGISLTEQEKTDIIAFLKTLTDDEFLKDSKFHNTN